MQLEFLAWSLEVTGVDKRHWRLFQMSELQNPKKTYMVAAVVCAIGESKRDFASFATEFVDCVTAVSLNNTLSRSF